MIEREYMYVSVDQKYLDSFQKQENMVNAHQLMEMAAWAGDCGQEDAANYFTEVATMLVEEAFDD